MNPMVPTSLFVILIEQFITLCSSDIRKHMNHIESSKLLILAAGQGTRLRPLTSNRPKPLVITDENRHILDYQIEAASNVGIQSARIITGYKANKIGKFASRVNHMDIETVYNPFFKEFNPLCSLWIGVNDLGKTGLIITNGDTIYTEAVFDAIHQNQTSQLVCSTTDSVQQDDMGVVTTNNHVDKVGKSLSPSQIDAISAGVFYISESDFELFRNIINDIARSDKHFTTGHYWHDIVEKMSGKGTVETRNVDKKEWFEIDTKKDLKKYSK